MPSEHDVLLGPNVKKLIAHKMSLDAIPPGTANPLKSAVDFLKTPWKLAESSRAAKEWALSAISLIRTAADPNPWKNADNESIAAELLKLIEERKKRNAERA